MKKFTSQSAMLATLVCLGATVPAFGNITYSCDAPSFAAASAPANLCATLNGTAGTQFAGGLAGFYSSTFTNANAKLFIQYGATGLASSLQYYTNVTYTAYVNALIAHEGDANDVTAVASLGGNVTNPVVNGDGVGLTSALETALGLTSADGGPFGILSTTQASCTLGTPNCYNGIITVTNASSTFYYRSGSQPNGTYDFFTTVEHETDEMLGTASCITGSGNNPATITTSCTHGPPTPGVSPADLFRYSAPGVRSFIGVGGNQANGTTACFSINSGTTNLACYNNTPNGADYGDWNGASNRTQNAFGTPSTNGVNITNDGGSEIALLDAVGFNLGSSVPEPATIGLLGASLAGLALLRRRR